MCGRYTLTHDLAGLEKIVRFICKAVDFKTRYRVSRLVNKARFDAPACLQPG